MQQQPNFSDCGIYLLQYVESFFRNPITDYTLPITSLRAWFPEDEASILLCAIDLPAVLRSGHFFEQLRKSEVPEPTPAPAILGQIRLRSKRQLQPAPAI